MCGFKLKCCYQFTVSSPEKLSIEPPWIPEKKPKEVYLIKIDIYYDYYSKRKYSISVEKNPL